MATHSSILARKNSRTEEPDGLYSLWGHKYTWLNIHPDKHTHTLTQYFCFIYNWIPIFFKSSWSRRQIWSFSIDPNSKIRATKGGGWTLHRPHISHSGSQDTFLKHAQKRLLGVQRGIMSRAILPRCLLVGSILAKGCICTHGRVLRKLNMELNQANHNGCTKENWKKCPT